MPRPHLPSWSSQEADRARLHLGAAPANPTVAEAVAQTTFARDGNDRPDRARRLLDLETNPAAARLHDALKAATA